MGIGAGAAAAIAAGVSAVGSVAGSLISSSAAGSAAGAQSAASAAGIKAQQQAFQQNAETQAPYYQEGQNALSVLNQMLPYTTSPTNIDEATVSATPGYKFVLDQGLQATQNSAAARGLGVSGAALKGAANFATGLADNTYQHQADNINANKTRMFNQLLGLGQLGQQSAVALGNNSVQTAGNVQSGYNAIGNAQAAGTVGQSNAISSGISGIGNAVGSYNAQNALLGNNIYGSATSSPWGGAGTTSAVGWG